MHNNVRGEGAGPSTTEASDAAPSSASLRRTWRFGSPIVLIEENIIIATPVAWSELSESSDLSWRSKAVNIDGQELIVASRLAS